MAANIFAAFFIHLWRMKWVCHNGQMVPENTALFTAANRGFRYGDGLFETAKVFQNQLLLAPLHLQRLFTGLKLLGIHPGKHFTPLLLEQHILELCHKNGFSHLARVRLAVYRSLNGEAGYVIETVELGEDVLQWNERGWTLVIYPPARKSCDAFANIKSAAYLPYVMAGQYAAEKGADEALVLNTESGIADGSKSNLFLLIDNEWYTPALNQGCVAGVMRQYLMDYLKKENRTVHETKITHEMLIEADEVFCTNAVQGMRWVARFENKAYGNTQTNALYKALIKSEYSL